MPSQPSQPEKMFTVTAVIQSNNIDGNAPVEVNYYTGTNGMKALSALGTAAANYEDTDPNLPKMYQVRTLSVRMDITDLPEPECSGRMPGARHTVPYCHKNEGGCAFHYPTDHAEQVSGNAASTSSQEV